MRRRLIFNLCGLFLAVTQCAAQTNTSVGVQHGGDIAMKTDEPFSILHGEYNVDKKTLEDYRPTWATVWKIEHYDKANGQFQIAFWPPKYCHAIYICPFPAQSYNDVVNFQTKEPLCQDHYIKYYPHAKVVYLKPKTTAEEVKYLMNNRLEFKIASDGKTYLYALKNLPKNHKEFIAEKAKDDRILFDFHDKDFLILTNSRMCQVNKLGSPFYPLFQKSIQSDTSSTFPKWLFDGSDLVNTDYQPSEKNTKNPKSVDLLSYLKGKTLENKRPGKTVKTCEPVGGMRAGGRVVPENAKFKRVSVSSYNLQIPNNAFKGKAFKQFSISVSNCHWFRMWVTELGTMDDYQKTMKLSETIDFFLNEGFYILPGSDVAHPLPDVNELTKFTFRVQPQKDPNNYVDMLYGEMMGKPIYHDQFQFPIFDASSFNVHFIKAPGCELSLSTRLNSWSDYSSEKQTNIWKVGTCKFSYFA